jgi:ethanolamine permease
MYPSSPGIRTYLKLAFDNRISLVFVYLYLIFMVLIAGVESYMFALVVRTSFPGLPTMGIVLGLLAFTITVNLLGFELPRGLQIITTILLLLCVVATGVYGCVHGSLDTRKLLSFGADNNLARQFKLLPTAIIMAVFLFTGFEWVTLLGFSPKAYERRIPLSMPLAIITLLLAYGVFALGLSAQLPRESITATAIPQVPYFLKLLGSSGGYVAGGISLLAIFSTFNAGIMGGGRLIYVLTREGNLPKWCAKMSLRTGAPVGGIILLGSLAAICSVVIVTFELEFLAGVVGSAIVSFVYAAFMLAVIVLRKKQPQTRRPFRTPVPRGLQWLIIVLLPAMGLMSLFSQVGMLYRPAVTLGAFIVLATIMARWSSLRTGR